MNISRVVVVADMMKALTHKVCVEESIGSCLLELVDGRIDSLASSCKGTRRKHLNVLGLTHLHMCVNHFLSGLA